MLEALQCWMRRMCSACGKRTPLSGTRHVDLYIILERVCLQASVRREYIVVQKLVQRFDTTAKLQLISSLGMFRIE